jgi:hypothetical protein
MQPGADVASQGGTNAAPHASSPDRLLAGVCIQRLLWEDTIPVRGVVGAAPLARPAHASPWRRPRSAGGGVGNPRPPLGARPGPSQRHVGPADSRDRDRIRRPTVTPIRPVSSVSTFFLTRRRQCPNCH